MRVGCPKEIKNHEYRVGLTPASVREYVAHGHEVWVETKAGAGIGADDAAYIAAGAKIAASAKDIFEKCDMIVKVKEPQPSEWAQLRDGQLLYTYLHLAPDPEQTKGLLASGVTAIAYETVTDERGGLHVHALQDLASRADGKALELWVIPPGQAPISVGVVAPDGQTALPRAQGLEGVQTLAITLEPPGGSPSGKPTGPVIMKGDVLKI